MSAKMTENHEPMICPPADELDAAFAEAGWRILPERGLSVARSNRGTVKLAREIEKGVKIGKDEGAPLPGAKSSG